MGKFEGKVVIVTGASSGIGEATAILFAKEGAKLVITGRNKDRLKDAGNKCKEAGAQVLEIVAELSKFENLEPIINKTVEKFGQIDVLVNNAGIGNFCAIDELDEKVYENLFQTNLKAPTFLSKFALPHLKKTKGCIVNVSSCGSIQIEAKTVAYGMTKAGLDHFTKGFAGECAPFGVRVNSINPGLVPTRFADALNLTEEAKKMALEHFKAKQPLGIISGDQIADGIFFLASHPMVTGIIMPVDGGFLTSS